MYSLQMEPVYYNQIGDVGMQSLAAHLQGLTNLQSLDLDNNQIGDVGAKVLGQHLQEVKEKTIYLGGNSISTETKNQLKQQCRGITWNF
jgi:Leucine-rich repeat (LRR) protein